MSKVAPVKWIEDLLTVHDLDLSGLPHDLRVDPGVPYREIDIHGGLHNRAREHSSLIENLWVDYALKMEAGSPFKVVTLYLVMNDGTFKYGVAHGNHRLRAFAYRHNDDAKFLRSDRAMIGAYVIPLAYNDDIEEYERLANIREGERQSDGYALNNAVWMVQHRKTTHKAAHERTGIAVSAISAKIAGDQLAAKIQKMGIDANLLSPTHLVRLASLKHDSHVKNLATLATQGRGIPIEDVSKMVTEVKRLRTEAKGNAFIHDEGHRLIRETAGPKNGQEPPELQRRRMFLKKFRQFEDLWLKGNEGRPISSLSDVGIAPQDRQVRQEMASRAQDLITIMERAMRLGDKAKV